MGIRGLIIILFAAFSPSLWALTDVRGSVDSNEILVKREIRLNANLEGKLFFEIRLPDRDDILSEFHLSRHQSYRGIEPIKIGEPSVRIITRDGKVYALTPGDKKWVKVLVLEDKREDYLGILSEVRNASFDEYLDRSWNLPRGVIPQEGLDAERLRERIYQIQTEWNFFADHKLNQMGAVRDDRGIWVTSHEIETCENQSQLKSISIPNYVRDFINDFVMHQCRYNETELGVCCHGECKVKKPTVQSPDYPCGNPVDECGNLNQAYTWAFEGQRCESLAADGKVHSGICYSGDCLFCKSDDPCVRNGTWNRDHCEKGEQKIDGAICGEGKVCLNKECVPFANLLTPNLMTLNEGIEALVGNTLDLEKISEFALAFDTSPSCPLSGGNGETCAVLGEPGLHACYNGRCEKCDFISDLKLKNAPPCPKSRLWTTKKGTRLSCGVPDVCVYE